MNATTHEQMEPSEASVTKSKAYNSERESISKDDLEGIINGSILQPAAGG